MSARFLVRGGFRCFWIGRGGALTLIAGLTACTPKAKIGADLHYPLHLDPQATSREYEAVLRARPSNSQMQPAQSAQAPSPEDLQLDQVLAAGKRNLDWLIFINAHRSTPLAFTKPGSLGGIPITSPKKYSGALVISQYQQLLQKLPPAMREILDQGRPFTENPPMADDDYTKLGNEMDKIYQSGLRWRLMQPYLDWYRQARANDIRGYYFLKDWPDLQTRLLDWEHTADADKSTLRTWLLSECFNTVMDAASCQAEWARAEQEQKLWDLHQKYESAARAMFQEFFAISNPRPDLNWKNAEPNQARLQFRVPGIAAIQDFLAKNIEDEWKWTDWGLHLDFQTQAEVHVEFQPGVTPHVNGIGGDTITMDANAPLSEWDVQWTIRHEFGHVLGFPDCYVEFYDDSEQAMVTYQIDIQNLMCARSGRFQQTHFDELKKNYLKN